jgi:N-sulfoglucosamine sulfohydrolase
LLVRWPGKIKPGTVDDAHFVSVVDFFPTFVEVTGVEGPGGLDGRSFLPLLRGERQDGREFVFTQIDSKAGGEAVPMRAVQNAKFGYIYNPFSDGKYWYRNNNEGQTMAAMNAAAENDREIAARVELFRHRVPEEFYDLEHDPNCLVNLIDSPPYSDAIESFRATLASQMEKTGDPMLKALQNRDNREIVDEVLTVTYGPRTSGNPAKQRKQTAKKSK